MAAQGLRVSPVHDTHRNIRQALVRQAVFCRSMETAERGSLNRFVCALAKGRPGGRTEIKGARGRIDFRAAALPEIFEFGPFANARNIYRQAGWEWREPTIRGRPRFCVMNFGEARNFEAFREVLNRSPGFRMTHLTGHPRWWAGKTPFPQGSLIGDYEKIPFRRLPFYGGLP